MLLPRGYSRSTRRYPVLYLLHGAVDDYRSWTTKGDAEALTAGLPLIVVMPDTGPIGGYVDWLRGGNRWETFHLTKLVPWIDRRYRTEGRRAGRAVAGLSMGGFGSLSYAARQPDSFAAAASFSGAVDSVNPAIQAVTPEDTYGPFATQEIRWRGKNPVDLAANLRGLRLVLRTGNGAPGGPFGGADGIEQVVHQAGVTLHGRLRALGIPHVWDDYGPGGHSWPYWQRDLRETLPALMRTFAHPRSPPAPFTYRSIEPTYEIYGWRVRIRRPALEWSRAAQGEPARVRARGQRPRARDQRSPLPARRAGARHGEGRPGPFPPGERDGRRRRARGARAGAGSRQQGAAVHTGRTHAQPPHAGAPARVSVRARPQRAVTAKSLAWPARVSSRKRTRPARTEEATRRPPTQAVTRLPRGRATSISSRPPADGRTYPRTEPGRTAIPTRGRRREKRRSGRRGRKRYPRAVGMMPGEPGGRVERPGGLVHDLAGVGVVEVDAAVARVRARTRRCRRRRRRSCRSSAAGRRRRAPRACCARARRSA